MEETHVSAWLCGAEFQIQGVFKGSSVRVAATTAAITISMRTSGAPPQGFQALRFQEPREWVVQRGQQLANGVIRLLPRVHGLLLQVLLTHLRQRRHMCGRVPRGVRITEHAACPSCRNERGQLAKCAP